LSAAGGISGVQPQSAATQALGGTATPVDLAEAADKIMNTVLQTVHTYQTSSGPALEARVNDPNLGDVRMIVTGRAGEIVQAQLVVQSRAAADAIAAAVTRMHNSGDALAGVSVTVRSEGGGNSTGGRPGNNAFESAAWGSGNGYGANAGPGSNGGHGQSLADPGAAAAGNGSGGQPSAGQGSREAPKPAPVIRPEVPTSTRTAPAKPLVGGSSLDIRA
jgi:hypothetical protein